MNRYKASWDERAVGTIAREMMRGMDEGPFKKATPEEIQRFTEQHRALIQEVLPYVPRGFSTIGAVVCKCAIEFDKARAIEFLANFKESLFQGREDPVFLFRKWFDGRTRVKKDRIRTYQVTLAACRAYCNQRQVKELRPAWASKDAFEWDNDWSYPSSKKNESSKEKMKL